MAQHSHTPLPGSDAAALLVAVQDAPASAEGQLVPMDTALGLTHADAQMDTVEDAARKATARTALCAIYTDLLRRLEVHSHYCETLCLYASKCATVAELGVAKMTGATALLQGLQLGMQAESALGRLGLPRKYLGIDIVDPPKEMYDRAHGICQALNMELSFVHGESQHAAMALPHRVELLFVDTVYTYAQTSLELAKYAAQVDRYLCLGCTYGLLAFEDQSVHEWYYDALPSTVDHSKRGRRTAIVDFLATHTDWRIVHDSSQGYGFMVLERHSAPQPIADGDNAQMIVN